MKQFSGLSFEPFVEDSGLDRTNVDNRFSSARPSTKNPLLSFARAPANYFLPHQVRNRRMRLMSRRASPE